MFQFTHPGRGATQQRRCDRTHPWRFNSRTPGGVRLRAHYVIAPEDGFQFTHPGRGATSTRSIRAAFAIVSIHAPREGCDPLSSARGAGVSSFNSRTPGGVRPTSQEPVETCWPFQFTHPGRGATSDLDYLDEVCSSFNSRTPGGVRRYRRPSSSLV